MATVTITGNTIRGATASKDNRTWQIRAVAYQYGGTGGGVITPGADWETLYPVDGVLTFTAEPGSVVDIKTPDAVPYRVRIPNGDAGLWDTIEAGVAYQPDVAQDNLNRAVANAAPGFIAAELGQQTADAITADLDAREITFTDEGGGEGYFSVGGVPVSGTLVPPSSAWSSLAGKPFVIAQGAGIDLTGATDSSAAFQAILDSAAAAAAAGSGLVEVHIPPGTLSLTTGVTVGAGVTLRGAGLGATTITSAYSPGGGIGVIELDGASDITIADLTIESTAGGSASICITGGYDGLQSRVAITRCRITGSTNNAVRFPYAVEQFTFSDNIIDDCDSGFIIYAPTTASGLETKQVSICRNRFRNVASVNLAMYGSYQPSTFSMFDVDVSHNDLREFAPNGVHHGTTIPIELTNITNVRVSHNTIEGTATRGISTGNNVNMTITGNTIRNQTIYAIELNKGRQIAIVGNTVEDCATFAQQTGTGLYDVVIANNVYAGSGGLSAFSTDAISLTDAHRVRITGNVFHDWEYLRAAIRLGNASPNIVTDCVVEGNTFVAEHANTPITAVNIRTAVRSSVCRNTFRVNRDTAAGDDVASSIIVVTQDSNTAETLIDGNQMIFAGSMAATTYVSGISNGNAAAGACPSLTICNNIIKNGNYGLRPVTNSTDLVIYNNETTTCGADNIPSTAKIGGNPIVAKVPVPASATAAGLPGMWAADASYLYVCTATNTWKRAAIATWP